MECGTIDQPPSFQHLTIWGLVTFIIMLILGIDSIYGVIDGCHFGDGFYSVLLLVGSAFGVAGLIFVILSIIQRNGTHMKLGALCFLISVIIHVVLLILYIIRGSGINVPSILQICLDIFLCYLFYRQSNGYSSSA